MRNSYLITVLLALLTITTTSAQIVELNPPFPTVDDDVTIIYDASQGSAELTGVSPVYIHTGVITVSGGAGNWQYVQGNWGTADANVVMTPQGNNIHTKTINIRDFYGIPQGVEVTDLAMVFRNADGSLEGKTEDYQDIFVPIYSSNAVLLAAFISPEEETLILNPGEQITVKGATSKNANISLSDNGTTLSSVANTNEINYTLTAGSVGEHEVILSATTSTESAADTFRYIVNPSVTVANPPAGTKLGLNRIDDNTIRLALYAPFKQNVYVIGDFYENEWQPNLNYYMNKSTDGKTWWVEIGGLSPGVDYSYQYLVDGSLNVADPYSEIILDPWNDQYIDSETYPNLPPYPSGKTTRIVTSFRTDGYPYDWQVTDFQKPAKTDLVIYELLMRDFTDVHNYQSLLDTLDYLENLGINAIEFMPINEFEGNESWGYNPSFHGALDKYYGDPQTFKAVVDECHARGIAVIVDAVYNHVFSQSPLARLYWNDALFQPDPSNPWLNVNAMHPFNVGYDVDHENAASKQWLDQMLAYWIDTYKIDGFRFDLSKGFTQNFTGGDVGAWGQYDASRIALLKRMADEVWTVDNDNYLILEHFADNGEETELANYGFMLWGNLNHAYNEATMGYNGDLTWGSYQARGWNSPHLVTYMESHDEERLMYKNLLFGNASGGYDIKNINTALARQELAGAFFFTIPGPKMIWQFGELGYDYSINTCTNGTVNENCRLDPKPIRWDYYDNASRNKLYQVWSQLIKLKKEYNTFRTTNYNLDVGGKVKRVRLNHPEMDAIVLGNFDVVAQNANPDFQHDGWWYEYFTGDSINVTNTQANFNLQAGEYRLYTDVRLTSGETVINTTKPSNETLSLALFPNPVDDNLFISFDNKNGNDIQLDLYDINGRLIYALYKGNTPSEQFTFPKGNLAAGVYFLRLQSNNELLTKKVIFR